MERYCGHSVANDYPACPICRAPLLIGDRYEVREQKGDPGSYGTVFECLDRDTGQSVAVKRFHDGIPVDDVLAELEALDIPPHANIVKLIDKSISDRFIVYEYQPDNLADFINKAPQQERAEQFCPIAFEIAEALRHAHTAYRYHRDLKPANILLDARGTVRVADFGIAAIVRWTGERRRTRAGTLGYMAPEVLDFGPYDHKADLYSLGVVFYEVLAGKSPWDDCTSEMDLQLRQRRNGWLPLEAACVGCPESLVDLIAAMMSADPQERPRNASAVVSTIKSWCNRDIPAAILSLTELQYAIDGIYSRVNRGKEIAYILSRLTAQLSSLTLGISTPPTDANLRRIKRSIASVFGWIAVAASFANTTLTEALVLKFGDGCPYCRKAPCTCDALTLDEVVHANQRRLEVLISRRGRPSSDASLDSCREMLDRIYGEKNDLRSPDEISLRLLQSSGQVADAALRFDSEDRSKALVFHLELADVVAWFFALATRAETLIDNDLYATLVGVYWRNGRWVCPRCTKPVCDCDKGYDLNFVDGWTVTGPERI